MTFMEKIRNSTDSTVMRVVFIIIVLVFVFWGVGSGAGMQTTQAIATVNGTRITDTQLQREMRGRTRNLGGGSMDEDEISALSKQVMEQLIAQEVLVQEATKIGLEVSTEEMQLYVLDIDAFKDADGKFSTELYGRSLKRMGLTKGKFEEQMRDDLLRNKLREVVAAGVNVSAAEVKDLYDRTATQAELSFVRILDEELMSQVVVEESDVDDFLAKSADQVTASYERDKARLYSKPRQLGFHRLVLKKGSAGVTDADLRVRMDDLLKQATEGTTFTDLVRRWSEDPTAESGGDAGLVAENVVAPQLASAILAAGPGKLSEVVETETALVLISVDEVVDAQITPIDSVKREIARTLLAQQRATSLGGERAEEILAAWKSTGTPPGELIISLGLSLEQAGPFSPTESFVAGLGVAPALVQAVSDLGGEGVLDGVYPAEGGRIVAAVTGWTGADAAQFEQLSQLLRSQMMQQKQQEVLQDWQSDLIASAQVERLMRN